MTKIKEITDFIEKDLVKKIQKELSNFHIVNERDFESIIFFHLYGFLKKKDNIKISTNYTIKGLPVEKLKGTRWTKADFIMPDIVISEKFDDYKEELKHLIAFELKTRKPGETNVPDFNSKMYELDFRKLNNLIKAEMVKKAYYFLVYSSGEDNEKKVTDQIRDLKFDVGKKKNKTSKKKFEIFVFNRYTDPEDRKKLIAHVEQLKIQHKGMKYVRTYHDNTESKTRRKYLERLQLEIENPDDY